MRHLIIALATFTASPAFAQIVTHSALLPDGGDSVVTILTARTTPAVKRGTDLVRCPDAPAYTYAVKGTPCPVTAQAAPKPKPLIANAPLVGINLAGGEFKGREDGMFLPKPDLLRAYAAEGFNLFRIPFKEVQLNQPASFAKLKAIAATCVDLRIPCIFDRHEYKWPPVAEQVAFWTKAARLLGPDAQLDLMNEPKGFNSTTVTNDWTQWAQDSQAIVTGLRDAGVANRIWLEWPGWSAVTRFGKGSTKPGRECGDAVCALSRLPTGTIVDPLNRTGLQGHRYFDKGTSGSSPTCITVNPGFEDFAIKALPFKMPVMIGESAYGSQRGVPSKCAHLAGKIRKQVATAPNFYGVTWWAGGPWNPKYTFYTPVGNYPYKRALLGQD